MRLNRILSIGLSILIVSAGAGIGVGKIKDQEIKANQEKYEEHILNYQQTIKDMSERLRMVEIEAEKTKDKLSIYEDAIEGYKAENRRLRQKVQEPKAYMPSRGQVGKTLTVEATAYTALCNTGCTGITATGIDVRNKITHNGYGVVAVDPRYIPLGSIVVINNKQYLAGDTGGRIKKNKIDILVGSKKEAIEFGRRKLEVIVLPKGGV
jgi:3D (Asp-Asp-Asp) domain-containing protein